MIMDEEIRIISSRTYDCANQSIFEESTLIHVYNSIHFMTMMWKFFIKFHKLRSSKTIAGRQAISENPIRLEAHNEQEQTMYCSRRWIIG